MKFKQAYEGITEMFIEVSDFMRKDTEAAAEDIKKHGFMIHFEQGGPGRIWLVAKRMEVRHEKHNSDV